MYKNQLYTKRLTIKMKTDGAGYIGPAEGYGGSKKCL